MGQQIATALRDSMHRVLVKLVSFLPGLLALLFAIALLALIGAALAFALRRILTAVKFDERFARSQSTNVSDWSPEHSPTTLVARTVFWACVVLGAIIGISAFDASYATAAMLPTSLLPYLTRVVGAALLLIAGTLIARFLARSVLIGAVNEQLQYARFLSLGIKWLVLVLTAAMVLDHLQLGGNIVALAFGILFGGIVLTLSLAVGLGSRDLVSRSLESHAEPPSAAPPAAPAASAAESIRHF